MQNVELQIGESLFSLETGKMAKQANGSVLVRYGDTTVLVAATAAKESQEGNDFLPLSVFFVEKAYAAGKIPGGFFKREGRLSDKETLISRLIDRPLRPMFDPNYFSETTVVATVLSYDHVNGPDVASLTGASAALYISDIPFMNPIAGIRVGCIDGQFIVNPTIDQLISSKLDIFMAGSRDAIIMVEGEAEEVSEEMMVDALIFGHENIQPLITLQEELANKSCKPKREIIVPEVNPEISSKVSEFATPKVQNALSIKDKLERYDAVDSVVGDTVLAIAGEDAEDKVKAEIEQLVSNIKKEEMRRKIITEGVRIDGRSSTDIRDISCETGILPRTHGSALFTRGETQALVVATLGTKDDEQLIDSLDGVCFKNFLLHYNFPSYSVGETRPPRGPGRREIGHGFLAERGLTEVVPTREEFPYTIRLVSEILESNGSSSMATVCGGSLAMMDAGVPLKAATAGIAMGLIKEGDNTVILSDILGDEDHLGDMDFKVVGTSNGITALQMDIKITGITREIIEKALAQAKDGRLHILDCMNTAIKIPREGLSSYAPRFVTHKIAKEKIRDVIGPGGKVIKGIVDKTGVKIHIDDDGIVYLSSTDHQAVDVALNMIRDLTRTVQIGEIYKGPVTRTAEYGAFVEIFQGQEGLVHISNLKEGPVRQTTDVVRQGDIVTVKAIGFDRRGMERQKP